MCGHQKCTSVRIGCENPQVTSFFEDLDSLAMRHLDELKQTIEEKAKSYMKVRNFQLEHRRSLTNYYEELERNQINKEKCEKLIEK